jgi:uncharacterized protein YjiS (DUF1127 family)
MSLSQSLPTNYTAASTRAPARQGGRQAVSNLLSRAFSLTRSLLHMATDNSRLSPETLRDIGLVRGEPPYVGARDKCCVDYRM